MPEQQLVPLPAIETTVWVLVGILISLLLPLAVSTLKTTPLEARKRKTGSTLGRLWLRVIAGWNEYGGSRYLAILLAAVLVAIVLVFLLGLTFYIPRDAALAGFAWESLINKLLGQRHQDADLTE